MVPVPLEALWIIFPAYLANASAVLVGGGPPVDFGKTWKGKPLLGAGKTWRGLLGGIGIGAVVGYLQAIVYPEYFGGYPVFLLTVFFLAAGALIGDITESFFKRRIGKKRGEKWFLADQLDFLIGALGVAFLGSILIEIAGLTESNWFLDTFSLWHILFLVFFTPLIHFIINNIGFKAGVKEVPW